VAVQLQHQIQPQRPLLLFAFPVKHGCPDQPLPMPSPSQDDVLIRVFFFLERYVLIRLGIVYRPLCGGIRVATHLVHGWALALATKGKTFLLLFFTVAVTASFTFHSRLFNQVTISCYSLVAAHGGNLVSVVK
jgi:hypothetical protein